MAQQANLTTVLGWDMAQFQAGMSRVEGLLGGLERKMEDAGKKSGLGFMAKFGLAMDGLAYMVKPFEMLASGIASAMGKAFDFGKAAVTAAGDLEATRTSIVAMLGGSEQAADRLIARLQKLGAETPFEFPELATSGKLLLAFQESAESIPEVLRRIGDVASATNAPISEIATLYGKARVEGVLFSKDVKELTGRGIPVLQEFAKQLSEVATIDTSKMFDVGRGQGFGAMQKMKIEAGDVLDIASEGKITFAMLERAFRDMTSKGGQYFGMMATQSERYKGALSNLSDAWGRIQVEFGKPLLETLTPTIKDAIAWLDSMRETAHEVGRAIGDWGLILRDSLKNASGIKEISAVLLTEFGYAAKKMANVLWDALSPVLDMFADGWDDMWAGIARKLDWIPGIDMPTEEETRGITIKRQRGPLWDMSTEDAARSRRIDDLRNPREAEIRKSMTDKGMLEPPKWLVDQMIKSQDEQVAILNSVASLLEQYVNPDLGSWE